MNKIYFLIATTFTVGCSTSHIRYQSVHPPEHIYQNILVLYIEGELDFHKLEEKSYQTELMGRYNNLVDMEYRNNLEKAVFRNLNGPLTRITRSSEIYPLNELVSYKDFMDTLFHQQVDAILLVNLNDYWYSTYHSYDSETGDYYENSQPNASYLFYLIDIKSLKPVCLGISRIYGIIAGYDTLNNKFARGLAAKLYKERFVIIIPTG